MCVCACVRVHTYIPLDFIVSDVKNIHGIYSETILSYVDVIIVHTNGWLATSKHFTGTNPMVVIKFYIIAASHLKLTSMMLPLCYT